jgi:hypothetical protein
MVHGKKERKRKRRIIIIRYDYNLTIMKSPKPATDTLPTYQILMISDNVEFLPPLLLLFLFLFFLSAKHELVHGRSQELLDRIS